MNYKKSNLTTISLLVSVLLLLWFISPIISDYRIAPLDNLTDTFENNAEDQQRQADEPIASGNSNTENNSRREDAVSPPSADQSTLNDLSNLARIDVLTEIGKRLTEEQYTEAENELSAMLDKLDSLSDAEKSAFLDFFIAYTSNNFIEPESVTAFDQLWSMLDMDPELRRTSSRKLGLHWVDSYELALGIPLLENVIASGGEIDATLTQSLAHAYFGMHQYDQAIPYFLQTIDLQFSQNQSVEREVFSELFEAYYRVGDLESAETVGIEILAQFNDIQDWKDMQQFYESTGDSNGLNTHMENARTRGFVSRDSDWVE